jgi:hypothetical protein
MELRSLTVIMMAVGNRISLVMVRARMNDTALPNDTILQINDMVLLSTIDMSLRINAILLLLPNDMILRTDDINLRLTDIFLPVDIMKRLERTSNRPGLLLSLSSQTKRDKKYPILFWRRSSMRIRFQAMTFLTLVRIQI